LAIEIQPQPGPQTVAMSSPADILVYGGAAGAGKSWFLVCEPLRHIHIPTFRAAISRQYMSQVFDPGGLWDEATRWYPEFGGVPQFQKHLWRFPSGAEIHFKHYEDERAERKWQGTQIAYLGVDELTHFTEKKFWVMMSRCRSVSGVRPYIRATCNPDRDSFVADYVAWWIDQETGYPLPERRGIIRYMGREGGIVRWADTLEEFQKNWPKLRCRTFTFVDGNLADNRVLTDLDPDYEANLQGMPLVERERLLRGNWKIRQTAGGVFNKDWWQRKDTAPQHFESLVRYWDKAGTITGDYTAGVLMGRLGNQYWILDIVRGKWTPDVRDRQIINTAEVDHQNFKGQVHLWLEKEPGAAGIQVQQQTTSKLARYGPRFDQPIGKGDKVVRANPFSAMCEQRNVYILNRSWTEDFIDEMAAFPTKGVNDDQVDASAGAFNRLVVSISMVPSSYTRGYRNSLDISS
jgi:predicted phage terminase large subunit-like protein